MTHVIYLALNAPYLCIVFRKIHIEITKKEETNQGFTFQNIKTANASFYKNLGDFLANSLCRIAALSATGIFFLVTWVSNPRSCHITFVSKPNIIHIQLQIRPILPVIFLHPIANMKRLMVLHPIQIITATKRYSTHRFRSILFHG